MNMLTRWVPGDILVAVGDGGVLALDGSAQALEAMWTELGEHRCLGDLLKSLSRLHDNEVFTLPDFLMMAIDGQELRVAARGRFCLHLDTADGERSFSASEVVVWEESRYERVNQCILELTPGHQTPSRSRRARRVPPPALGDRPSLSAAHRFRSPPAPIVFTGSDRRSRRSGGTAAIGGPRDPPAGSGRRRPRAGRPTAVVIATCEAGAGGGRPPIPPRSRTDAGTAVHGPAGRYRLPAGDRGGGSGRGTGARRRSGGRGRSSKGTGAADPGQERRSSC